MKRSDLLYVAILGVIMPMFALGCRYIVDFRWIVCSVNARPSQNGIRLAYKLVLLENVKIYPIWIHEMRQLRVITVRSLHLSCCRSFREEIRVQYQICKPCAVSSQLETRPPGDSDGLLHKLVNITTAPSLNLFEDDLKRPLTIAVKRFIFLAEKLKRSFKN